MPNASMPACIARGALFEINSTSPSAQATSPAASHLPKGDASAPQENAAHRKAAEASGLASQSPRWLARCSATRQAATSAAHTSTGNTAQRSGDQSGASIWKPTGWPQWLRKLTPCTGVRGATRQRPVGYPKLTQPLKFQP